MEKKLKFTYDINTIDHLGVKLYSTIPPMLAELISNAWDADAHLVNVKFENGENKSISVVDNGVGMSFDELNDKFLKVGRNRRTDLEKDFTESGRAVLGKKGLGKLSMFGIGKLITITSIKDGMKNSFVMDYEDIKTASTGEYEPRLICVDESTDDQNGTSIVIEQISRKTDFDLSSIEQGIRDRFRIFSDDFVVNIGDEITINDCSIPEGRFQFTWKFPGDYVGDLRQELLEFGIEKGIIGTIYTSQTPLNSNQQGIVLFSRGKLVQENKNFDKRGNDNFFLYMTGDFNVDFIDRDLAIDNCSTDRKSLAWDNYENDELLLLEELLQEIVSVTQSKWRKNRKEAKEKKLVEQGEDITNWIKTLTKTEQPLARKLISAVLENDNISDEQTKGFVETIKDMYGFKSFQDFTAELADMERLDDETAIKLLTDWNLIEAKEYARIAMGRIETIEQFDKYVKEDASETKVIQKFLEEFPWLLDPKMSSFEREVTYSKILKDNFPDEDLPEHDRRLDFLCTDNNGMVHVIELKRPSIKITVKQIDQVVQYIEFLRNHYPNNAKKIEGYLISDRMTYDPGVQTFIDGMKTQGVYVKSYSDLLAEARRYNKQFYDKYEELIDANRNE